MKTPREILLARHALAQPKLDAIRRQAVEELCHQTGTAPDVKSAADSWWARALETLWRELVLPSRRTWTALAATWILILGINIGLRDPATSGSGSAMGASAVAVSWQTQQRWMNELLADRTMPPDVDRPKYDSGKPRTETVRAAAV